MEVGACCIQVAFWKTCFGTLICLLAIVGSEFNVSVQLGIFGNWIVLGFPLLKFGDVVALK